MKKPIKIFLISVAILLVLGVTFYLALPQVFAQKIKTYKGGQQFAWATPKLDSTKKTVVVVADNDGTEMFDLLAPFYLFNASGKANVLVVAERKAPILLVNSLFILPHYSFSEIDSLHIIPDVIVIPNLTVRLKTPPKPSNVAWIKRHYTGTNIILSICDGSATAAATGLYDGRPLTTHATDFETLQKQYPKPAWVKDVSVTQSGNLYSTAGVSNAVEGSLTVIRRLFGEQTLQSVLRDVHYPHTDIKVEHDSRPVNKGAIIQIVSKMLFQGNSKMGVWLTDGLNEFELASVLDTYARTFPQTLNTFSSQRSVSSKYGLTLYPTGSLKSNKLNELHVLDSNSLNVSTNDFNINARIVTYDSGQNLYPIDVCLKRIAGLYGVNFSNCVKLTLDYN